MRRETRFVYYCLSKSLRNTRGSNFMSVRSKFIRARGRKNETKRPDRRKLFRAVDLAVYAGISVRSRKISAVNSSHRKPPAVPGRTATRGKEKRKAVRLQWREQSFAPATTRITRVKPPPSRFSALVPLALSRKMPTWGEKKVGWLSPSNYFLLIYLPPGLFSRLSRLFSYFVTLSRLTQRERERESEMIITRKSKREEARLKLSSKRRISFEEV